MTDDNNATSPTREVVGLFAERTAFEAAIGGLMDAGFERSDLSVLSSHESIDAAGSPGKPWSDALTAMVGELKFEAPLVASGAIFLVGGPMAASVAGISGRTRTAFSRTPADGWVRAFVAASNAGLLSSCNTPSPCSVFNA